MKAQKTLKYPGWVKILGVVLPLLVLGCDGEKLPPKPAGKPAEKAPITPVAASESLSGEHFHVAVIGIGPGEPDLITVRAKRCLATADRVVCFDWLSNEVAYHLGGSEKIEVVTFESLGTDDSRARAKFCAMVRRWLADGKKVVFATSGDPTVCSPMSWVTDRFADWHPVVVPGVGSIPAAAAELAQSIMNDGAVMISTGDRFLDVNDKGRLADVAVFFTHLRPIDRFMPELIKRYPGDTPVAIVGDAARAGVEPTVIRSTLANFNETLSKTELPKLYLVFIGDPLAKDTTVSLPDHHPRFDAGDDASEKR